eukprot:scaffold5076_cov123-Skeletonema_dohrnii-CCMP3373.AAC.8
MLDMLHTEHRTEHVAFWLDPIGYRCTARIRGTLMNDSFIAPLQAIASCKLQVAMSKEMQRKHPSLVFL